MYSSYPLTPVFFFFNDTATTEIYTLSLHDALPISRFPRRVNAGYVQIVTRTHIRLRVWERGAGETLACGTGACAAVVAGIREGLLDDSVRVDTRGGRLTIRWAGGENDPTCTVWMTGPAVSVFEGEIEIES